MRKVSFVLLLLSTTEALIPQPQLRPQQLPTRLTRSHSLVATATESEGSSVASSTVNLVKAIVGSGVLSLPVGIAAFSSSRKALIPALAMLSIIGTLSAYCFAMVGRVCMATGTKTWGEAWTETVGEKSAWIPSSFVAILCASASLQYTMVIGDSFAPIFAAAGMPKLLASRSGAIAVVTALCTLPLSLLPNLEMLKYTSFLGIGGLLYTAAFMASRVGAYKPGSAFHEAVPAALKPQFSAGFTLGSMLHPKVFVLLSILATAFCAHFLSPQFLAQLSDTKATDGSTESKLPRFGLLTAGGFALSAVLSAVVMVSGFLTFGGAADGYILNNYATADRLAQLARLAIGGSIVTTYPLLHQGLRDTVQEALAQKGIAASRQAITFTMVLGIMLVGMKLTDLGVVAAVSGALVSTSLVYVLPSIMFGQMLAARKDKSQLAKLELLGSRLVTVLGVFMVAVGMKAAF
jgi:sodium-coupled neutral amino acid transporter 11